MRFLNNNQKKFEAPFEISQNLIIVPATINGSQTMKFILDSGISKTIITEMTGIDTVNLSIAREVKIEGLGKDDPLTAWYSEDNELILENNLVKGQGLIYEDAEIYVIPENNFEFSRQFGLQINGLIGADFFMNFVVEINYLTRKVIFHKREDFNFKRKTKKHQSIPIEIKKQRPFIKAQILQDDGTQVEVNLLIDTGASMAMWLSQFSDKRIQLPEITYPALLGQGLSGNIEGLNGRVDKVTIGSYIIDKPIVAFPDSVGISGMQRDSARNGTLGNEILKRFHVIFDYQGGTIFLKPTRKIREPFNYNRSGLEIEKPVFALPIYQVYNVVKDSPADLAGIKPGDQIEMINFIRASNIELDHINSILYGNEGKTVRLTIRRDSELLKFQFSLDDKL